jgi:hypothetical protein
MCGFGSGYRVFTIYWWRHWLRYRTYTHPFIFAYQRITRGWADCDTWSLDLHLCRILPGALRHLIKNKHGVPSELCPEGRSVDEAAKEFDEILEQIAQGFETGIEWFESHPLDEQKKEKFDKGMALFNKWFFSLWD